MGRGYWILMWDDFGSGLNLINPRLFTDESGRNWWPCQENTTVEEVLKKHKLDGSTEQIIHCHVIFN